MTIVKTFFSLSTIAVTLFSCETDESDLLEENEKFVMHNPATTAQVKFIHVFPPLTPNATTSAPSGPRFDIFSNGRKINGMTTTSTVANGLAYGGVFPFTPYSFLSVGSNDLMFRVHRIFEGALAPEAGDTVFNASVSFEAGKKYSVFLADKPDPGLMIVENNSESAPLNFYQLRFINLCADVNDSYDLYSLRHGSLFSNVSYKEISQYITLEKTETSDTLRLFLAGTSTILASVNAFSAAPQQVYTFYAFGKTSVGTTRKPALTYYPER